MSINVIKVPSLSSSKDPRDSFGRTHNVSGRKYDRFDPEVNISEHAKQETRIYGINSSTKSRFDYR